MKSIIESARERLRKFWPKWPSHDPDAEVWSPAELTVSVRVLTERVEGLERDHYADKRPGPSDDKVPAVDPVSEPYKLPEDHHKPQPKRFTAPEALPVGALVKVLDVSPADCNPQHKVGDILTVIDSRDGRIMVSGEISFWSGARDPDGHQCYLAGTGVGGTWVRTVELVEPAKPAESEPVCKNCGQSFDVCDDPNRCAFPELAKPVESEPSGNPDCACEIGIVCVGCANKLQDVTNVSTECQRLRSELTRLTEENARLTRERDEAMRELSSALANRQRLSEDNARLVSGLSENQQLRRELSERMQKTESERDTLTARVKELEAELAALPWIKTRRPIMPHDAQLEEWESALEQWAKGQENESYNGEQMRSFRDGYLAANARVRELENMVRDLSGFRDKLDAANVRAERMGALVVIARSAYEHGELTFGEQERLGEALAALDSLPAESSKEAK